MSSSTDFEHYNFLEASDSQDPLYSWVFPTGGKIQNMHSTGLIIRTLFRPMAFYWFIDQLLFEHVYEYMKALQLYHRISLISH